jgi:hypothetical protein
LPKSWLKQRTLWALKEIAENLVHKNRSVQSDCLKFLSEIGYLKPALMADYVAAFLVFNY